MAYYRVSYKAVAREDDLLVKADSPQAARCIVEGRSEQMLDLEEYEAKEETEPTEYAFNEPVQMQGR